MDYVVIGAGPAGLQLGYFLQQAGRDYLVLEAGPTPGTFYRAFPRHRRMISINKPHTGWGDPEKDLRVDWNSLLSDDPALRFTGYTDRYFPHADDYVRYLTDFGRGLNIRYGSRVRRLTRGSEGFELSCENGELVRARRVIVATGLGAMSIPAVPGIEATEVRLAHALHRPPARGEQQFPGHLPAQDPEHGAGRRHPEHRAPSR